MSNTTYIIRPDNDVRIRVLHHVGNLNPDIPWEVTIGKHKKNKTRLQERYFHKLVDIICKFNGDKKKDMKRRICWSCGLVDEFTTEEGEKIICPRSTSGLTSSQYSDIIEAAQDICLILGLSYPSAKSLGY